MAQPRRRYLPDPSAQAVYGELFGLYGQLHDAFGAVRSSDLGAVMKRLLDLADRVRAAAATEQAA